MTAPAKTRGYELEAELVSACKLAAGHKGLFLEVAGQRKAKGSGSDRGLPDAFLCAGGRMLPIEFKRPKTDGTRRGVFSLDQLVAAERRRACGVETYCPDTLEAFTALANWMRCGRTARPRCPVVPGP
jgi:hypothetical protein